MSDGTPALIGEVLMPTDAETALIRTFLAEHFGEGYTPGTHSPDEEGVILSVLAFVENRFSRSRFQMGLAIDMALLAQQLSLHDPTAKAARIGLTEEQLFARYPLVQERSGTSTSTLTLIYGDGQSRWEFGIRRLEEKVLNLFVSLKRPGYPSAYAHNTGEWAKYKDTLLLPAFRLSEAGRFALCHRLIEFGLANLTVAVPLGREKPRVRVFEEVIRNYPRTRQPRELAGSVFQGIAAGYVKADRPHLSLVVDKTRTGSAKQRRIGDIDGYHGLDLEVSVEVKDSPLTGANVQNEMGEFLAKVVENRVMGLVFVLSADEVAVETIRGHGAVLVTQVDLLASVERWDWRKQDVAVHGLLHFLANVEQNPDAVARLLAFIREVDPGHESLTVHPAAQTPSS